MHFRQALSFIALPAAALSLPSTLLEPRTAQECKLYKYPDPPHDGGGACWAWSAATDTPSEYCDPSAFGTVDDIDSSADWIKDCTSLRESELGESRDLLLAEFLTTDFNTLLSKGKCAFQVKPEPREDENDNDQIYIGGQDIMDLLQMSVERSQDGTVGVKGTTKCWSYALEWRVVPN